LGDAPARLKPPGVLKCSEAAEERSGWNCWFKPGYQGLYQKKPLRHSHQKGK